MRESEANGSERDPRGRATAPDGVGLRAYRIADRGWDAAPIVNAQIVVPYYALHTAV
jgi:hypothetical protein